MHKQIHVFNSNKLKKHKDIHYTDTADLNAIRMTDNKPCLKAFNKGFWHNILEHSLLFQSIYTSFYFPPPQTIFYCLSSSSSLSHGVCNTSVGGRITDKIHNVLDSTTQPWAWHILACPISCCTLYDCKPHQRKLTLIQKSKQDLHSPLTCTQR